MPFIDNDFKITPLIQTKRILLTTADEAPVYKATENLAKFLQSQQQRTLLIDGDLGNGTADNPELSQVLHDNAALPKAVKHINQLSVLSGKADTSLAQNSQSFKMQFFSDLQIYEELFDRVIIAISSQNTHLQQLWLDWTDKTFLYFKNDNLSMEKTVNFLINHTHQIHGLIGSDKNPHETRLAWIRLKQIVPDAPDLILDIQKIAL